MPPLFAARLGKNVTGKLKGVRLMQQPVRNIVRISPKATVVKGSYVPTVTARNRLKNARWRAKIATIRIAAEGLNALMHTLDIPHRQMFKRGHA